MSDNIFRWRAFVSFLLLFSFLLSALSGVVLFLRPEGSLAAWSGWSVLGLGKKQWEELHAVMVLLFLAGAVAHLLYNWRGLAAHCRRRREQVASLLRARGGCRELFAALLLSVLALAAAQGGWLPARWLFSLRAAFKSGPVGGASQPPVADAQTRTLAEIGRLLGLDEAGLLSAAAAVGIRVESPAQTLEDIARKNGLSPQEVYRRLSAANKKLE